MPVYDKKSVLDNRYQLLATSSIYTYEDENLTSYAEFLKKFGRYIGKDGFLDAKSTIHRYKLKQKDIDKQKSFSGSLERKPDEKSLTALVKDNEDRRKLHNKHLVLIEDQMIQSKQEERALKRQEGDVKKEQRAIRQAMKELDGGISKKRLEADKNLSKNLEEKNRLEIENAHKKENATKERTEYIVDTLQQTKDKGRKNLLMCNDLARQYKLKMSELEIKHSELKRLYNDYEDQIRAKEEEENRVKKEIFEIGIALNMEANKVKNELFDFQQMLKRGKEKQIKTDLESELNLDKKIGLTSNYIKNYDLTRRRLSHDAILEKSVWSLKQREANRRIVDTRNSLEEIYNRQKKMNETVQISEQERKAHDIMQKIEDVTKRKLELSNRKAQEKKEQSSQLEDLYSKKANAKFIDVEIQENEDNLKHLQKVSQKHDEQEHELYKAVKENEFSRRKHEKSLKQLQEQLKLKKKENSIALKELLTKISSEEEMMQNNIYKQKAQLDKYHAEREEAYLKLISHREKFKEDKFLLEKVENKQNRLVRIMEKSVQSNRSA